MLAVHVRINDDATGRPVPVCLRITDAGGRYLPPLGRLAAFATSPGQNVGGQVRLGAQSYAFIDGACEAMLPPGILHVEAERGPEYVPLSKQVSLTAGKLSLRLGIGRWADWSADGWLAGDVRAHDLSPRAAALEGAACGLAVVQLLARQRPGRDGEPAAISGVLDFSGSELAHDAHGCQVAVNTLNEHPILGSVALLNSHRPVYPLRFGAPDADDWSVSDWCDQCHRKAGLVVWPDLPRLTPESPQGEALAAMILGKIDAFELGPVAEPYGPSLAAYYRLLDCGLRPSLVGGSGKDSNAATLGAMRTYARVAPPETWLAAVRAGRTFVTTGPLLTLSVSGHGPGDVVRIDKGQRFHLRAEATSRVPFDYLELVVNGESHAAKPASGNRLSTVIETDLVCDGSAWVAAVAHSATRQRDGACVFAHTNPVFLDVADEPIRPSGQTAAPLLGVLAQTKTWAEREARFDEERSRDRIVAALDEAAAKLNAER